MSELLVAHNARAKVLFLSKGRWQTRATLSGDTIKPILKGDMSMQELLNLDSSSRLTGREYEEVVDFIINLPIFTYHFACELNPYNSLPDLARLLPSVNEPVKHPETGKTAELFATVINLNDSWRWTREQIADWLESLDINLEFSEPDYGDPWWEDLGVTDIEQYRMWIDTISSNYKMLMATSYKVIS